MKRLMFFICGIFWLAFGLATGFLSWRYLAGGPDVPTSNLIYQILGPVSSTSILIGLVHVTGFVALTALCLAIGISLCLYSLEPRQCDEEKVVSQKPS